MYGVAGAGGGAGDEDDLGDVRVTATNAIVLAVCVMFVLIAMQTVLTGPSCIECGGKLKHRKGCRQGAP